MNTNPSSLSLWAPVVLHMALIFGLSSIANPPDVEGPPGLDKYVHVALYAGLSGLLVRALARGWSRPVTRGVAIAAAILAAMYGITDEIHQVFVPPREMDVLDLAADAAGAALAAALLYTGIIRRRHGV